MKNHELFALLNKMGSLSGLKGVRFTYALNRNRDRLKKETERLSESAKPSDEFTAFEEAQRKLFMSMAIKDENGNPKLIKEGGKEVNKIAEEDMAEFLAKAEELKVEHKDAVEARETQIEEYNELLNSDVSADFEFYKLKLEVVPEDITDEQMAVIMPFIEEEE